MANNYMTLKVDKVIVPLHFSLREHPELIIGKDYYISFGNNVVHPCILLEVYNNEEMVSIEIKTKSGKSNGINKVYFKEIGDTPEKAVINTVTS